MDPSEYVKKLRSTLDSLQVKANLAKLELREMRHDLLEEYDSLRNRVDELQDATGDRLAATAAGLESAWQAFKKKYDDAMSGSGG